MTVQLVQRLLYFLLAVPMIGGGPWAERPFRRQLCRAEKAHVLLNYLRRRAGKQNDVAALRHIDFYFVLPEGKFCRLQCVHIHAHPSICPEERSRAIGLFTLKAEFFLHAVYRRSTLLVDGVIFFSHAERRAVGNMHRQQGAPSPSPSCTIFAVPEGACQASARFSALNLIRFISFTLLCRLP